jgi:hypothetical protein
MFKSHDYVGLDSKDVEVHLHVIQTMTEHFQLCEWGHCRFGKLHRCSDAPDYPNCPRTPLQ